MPRRTLLICLLVASGCTTTESPELNMTAPTITAADETPTMPSIEPADVATLAGVVREVRPAGHYTYVRVGAPGAAGDWAVVLGPLEAAPGEAITLSVQGSQTDFHSRRLDHEFDRLFFASVPSPA